MTRSGPGRKIVVFWIKIRLRSDQIWTVPSCTPPHIGPKKAWIEELVLIWVPTAHVLIWVACMLSGYSCFSLQQTSPPPLVVITRNAFCGTNGCTNFAPSSSKIIFCSTALQEWSQHIESIAGKSYSGLVVVLPEECILATQGGKAGIGCSGKL